MSTAGSDLLTQLRACRSAEEYFELLGVPYDPRVVNVNRLHILRHFAGALAALPAPGGGDSPSGELAKYRAALADSYQAFVTGTALDHRLFKVLRDRAPVVFIPQAQVTVLRRDPSLP